MKFPCDITKIFAAMFKCPVVNALKLGRTKCWHPLCYSIAPCFCRLPEEELNLGLFYATSFDECFSKVN